MNSPLLKTPSKFASRSPRDLADLVAGHPLAWLCSAGPGGLQATPLPLLLLHDDAGQLIAVEGHLARGNAQVEALRRDPQALVLWMGAQGYVSPSWMTDRTQAPSWNYVAAQCQVAVNFVDDASLLRHLGDLARTHEAGRQRAWSVDEMGPRLHQLAQRVIGFRAEVIHLQQRYKLGQDEREDVFADILGGLAAERTSGALIDWMRRFNPDRGPAATAIDPSAAATPSPRP
jgi:transcriptional regulator